MFTHHSDFRCRPASSGLDGASENKKVNDIALSHLESVRVHVKVTFIIDKTADIVDVREGPSVKFVSYFLKNATTGNRFPWFAVLIVLT